MEEIKVGDYVRTTNKGIRQIAMINNNKTVNKYLYYIGEDFEGKSYAYIKTTEILKHSSNLIDLIEIGDIVNGHLVVGKYKDANDIDVLVIEDDAFANKTISDIKTILTYEQYKEHCFKVGEK